MRAPLIWVFGLLSLWACTSTNTTHTGREEVLETEAPSGAHTHEATAPQGSPWYPSSPGNKQLRDHRGDFFTPAPSLAPPTMARPAVEGLHGMATDLLLRGANLPGGARVDIAIHGGRIQMVAPTGEHEFLPGRELDCRERWVTPAFIDSHVHLAYLPVQEELLNNGISAVVDLASPMEFLGRDHGQLQVRASGPMLTASRGYPTRSWGADGYGIECGDVSCVEQAVQTLTEAGAHLIKIPLGQPPQLRRDQLEALMGRSAQSGLPIVGHALNVDGVALAVEMGVHVLAHTPVEPLSRSMVSAWRGRAVISTLAAFGGTASTVANLRAFRETGARILYGTDLGNTREAGIQSRELQLLVAAGLSGREIVAAGTSTPAEFWQLNDLGKIEMGAQASLLLLEADPYQSPLTLAEPETVIIAGRIRP